MRKTARAVVALLLLSAFGVHAQTGENPWAFNVSPRILGLDLGAGYRMGLTTLWVHVGGGYEGMHYYRQSEELITAAFTGLEPSYDRAEAKWQLGIVQALIPDIEGGSNFLEAHVFYRGRYDRHIFDASTLLDSSGAPDRDGIFQNSLFVALDLNDLHTDPHKVRSGYSAEVSAEWGPGFLFNSVFGSADFLRLNATARGFLPLFDIAAGFPLNLVSAYIGDFVSVDYALGIGAPVPINVRQSFGGISPRTGLGGAVRGLDTGSLDTSLKIVNNFDFRVNLPAIFLPNLVPGMVVYWDMGWYSQVGEGSLSTPAPPSGFVSTIGAGLFINVLDIATLVGYTHYRLVGVNANGSAFTPFTIEFGLQF